MIKTTEPITWKILPDPSFGPAHEFPCMRCKAEVATILVKIHEHDGDLGHFRLCLCADCAAMNAATIWDDMIGGR